MTAAAEPESTPRQALLSGLSDATRDQVIGALEALGIAVAAEPPASILLVDASELVNSDEARLSQFDRVVAVIGSLPTVVTTAHVVVDAPVTREGVLAALGAAEPLPVDAATIAAISLLGGSLDEALDRTACQLLEALGARSVFLLKRGDERA